MMRRSFPSLSCYEFWPRFAIQSCGQAEQVSSGVGDAPAPSSWDFGYELTHVQSFDEASDGGALFRRRLDALAEQGVPDVFVAKAASDVVAIEDRGEESDLFTPGRIETGRVASRRTFRFGQFAEFLVCRGRIIDDGQGVEVAAVAGESLLLIVDQAAGVLVHGEETLRGRAIAMEAGATDEELLGAVDDGFHPQDEAELVVHFQPVARHAMLDARADYAVGFNVGLNVAVEAAIPFAAEKAQDVFGSEGHGRKLNELLIEARQGGGALENEVGGELRLIDDPADAVVRQFLAQQRVDLVSMAAEDLGPVEPSESIGLTLSFGRFVELGEGVVLADEAQAQTNQLLREPMVAVGVDLEREGSPGLQADVDEAQLRIEKVVVEDALLPRPGDESGPFLAGDEGERIAGFQSAEDADETVFDGLFAEEPFRPGFFLKRTGAIEIRSPRLASDPLGVLDERFGPLGSDDVHEVATPNLERPIDESFEFRRRCDGKMTFEDHAVKAMQRANDETGKLGDETPYCVHGILSRLAVVSTNHSGG